MLSTAAEKLLLYFNRYKVTPGSYFYHLETTKAAPHGDFATAFTELLVQYGYSY